MLQQGFVLNNEQANVTQCTVAAANYSNGSSLTILVEYDDNDVDKKVSNGSQSEQNSDSVLIRDEESTTVDHIKVVIKYGGAITDLASSILVGIISSGYGKWREGDDSGRKCVGRGGLLPFGKTWGSAAGYYYAETCASSGQKCSTKASQSALEDAANWADNELDNDPNADSWKVGFSNQGAWKFCVRVVPKAACNSYSDCYDKAHNMGCPADFCSGDAFKNHDHDEL
ncbi:unnamed protein product [Debaryomyces tyrocola]|nr:unnamed protein product [Debaryomyces tyrocola]